MSAFVQTRSLVHTYALENGAEVRALQEIDLTIDRGEWVAIVGPNGSGKSTLARHLNGLLLPTSGEVWIDGMPTADPQNRWAIRERVGMVFQNPENQLVASTVEDDIAFGPENLGLPPDLIRRRVDEALRLVGLTDHAARPPHTLSGGQKQRAAIAGVLASRPRCIVLDEPTAMLDPSGQAQTIDTIQRLHRDAGITVILITQSMDEAAMADRVLVMADGRVVLDGPPVDVFLHEHALTELGLDLPMAVRIGNLLRELGLSVPQGLLTVEQLAGALC